MRPLLQISLLLFSILSSFKVCAQDKVTLYYDQYGKGVDTKKKAAFYREVVFDHNNKPTGTIFDFYINGNPLRKGHASTIDKLDDAKSAWFGSVSTFNENGVVNAVNNYDADGNLDSLQTIFYPNKSIETSEYSHGNPTKNYFLVTDSNDVSVKYSYLTHLPVKPSIYNYVVVPVNLRKMIYQDGQVVQFYDIDGLYVAVKISTKQLYGDYYEAYINIENGTQPQFDFDPVNITASLGNQGEYSEAEVLSYYDYMKKVDSQESEIRQEISDGYLKINTILPNSRLEGFVNIKKQDADHIILNVPVNGKLYHFEW